MGRRIARVLAVVYSAALVALGILEVVEPAEVGAKHALWLLLLFLAPPIILVGKFVLSDQPHLRSALVAVGAVMGMIPTFKTVVLPVVALALVFLTLRDQASAPPPRGVPRPRRPPDLTGTDTVPRARL